MPKMPPGTGRPWQAFSWAIKFGTECASKPNLLIVQFNPAKIKIKMPCTVWMDVNALQIPIFFSLERQRRHELTFGSDHVLGGWQEKENQTV